MAAIQLYKRLAYMFSMFRAFFKSRGWEHRQDGRRQFVATSEDQKSRGMPSMASRYDFGAVFGWPV